MHDRSSGTRNINVKIKSKFHKDYRYFLDRVDVLDYWMRGEIKVSLNKRYLQIEIKL